MNRVLIVLVTGTISTSAETTVLDSWPHLGAA